MRFGRGLFNAVPIYAHTPSSHLEGVIFCKFRIFFAEIQHSMSSWWNLKCSLFQNMIISLRKIRIFIFFYWPTPVNLPKSEQPKN